MADHAINILCCIRQTVHRHGKAAFGIYKLAWVFGLQHVLPCGRYEEAARISISSPKQMSIGGRSHAVNRASRPSSALSRQSPNAAVAAGHDASATRPASGLSTPVKSGSATPQKPAGSSTPKRAGASRASAVVGALGRLSPQEVDRLQRVLQQGGAHT